MATTKITIIPRLPVSISALIWVLASSLSAPSTVQAEIEAYDIHYYVDRHGVKHINNKPVKGTGKRKSLQPKPVKLQPIWNTAYDRVLKQAATTYKMDPALVKAIIHVESAFKPTALSHKGASGLMQLMPETAKRYGVRHIFDPVENITAGVRYLRDLLRLFNDDLKLVVAAYNAGEGAVQRYGGVPPYPETINYVSRVLHLHKRYKNPS